MKTLLYKEFTWNWRSFRFPALLLVFLFFALLDPVTTKYMSQIFAQFADFEMTLPEPTAEGAFFAYLNSVSQIGIMVMIFIIMGIVAKEKETGVAAWILSKPVGRWNYLLAKVINLYALLILGLSATSAIAYFYTWSLIGQVTVNDAIWATISIIVYAIFIASLTFSLSTVMRTPLQAGGVAITIFFLMGIGNFVISRSAIYKFYPNTLLGQMGILLQGASNPAEVAIPIITTIGLSLLLLFLAGKRFAKIEL